jgi:cysteinyl-tRNA synthetase
LERAGDGAGAGGDEDPPLAERRDAFFAALRDDFNTPQALAALFDFVSEGNRRLEAGERPAGAGRMLAEMLQVVGLETLLAPEQPLDEEAVRLAGEREQARRDGDYARADSLRDRLTALGYEVRDTDSGPELVRSGDPGGG